MIRRVRWVAAACAAVAVLIAGALIAQGGLDRNLHRVTLWVGADAGVLWIIGVALCAAALVAPIPRDGLLMAIIAAAWVSPVFVSWLGGIGIAVAAGPAVAALAVPAMWQLLLDATARAGPIRRLCVSVVWGACGAAALVLLFLRDPFLDIRCAGECGPNPVLVAPLPGAVALAHSVLDAVAVIVAGAALVWAVDRMIRRSRLTPLAPVPALVVSGAAGASWWLPLADGAAPLLLLEPAMAGALAILAGVRIGVGVSALLRRSALRELADDLAAGSEDDLRGRLASALGVAGLEVLYPLDDGSWTDASGSARERPHGVDVAEIRREGIPIALVVGADGRAEVDAIGPAAGLAIDNERLRAGISANLSALRRSRLGVVESGDAERRRIERNLHDGMQQSLLILQYELGLAATREEDPRRRARLETLRGEAHHIIERLREIAHGVFPAALDDLGVEAALQRLADDTPFPLEISGSIDPRAPRPIERTVYLVASEALAGGARPGPAMTVDLARAPDIVSVRTDNAITEVSLTLRDRIEALGGRVTTREDGLEVELPCVSS